MICPTPQPAAFPVVRLAVAVIEPWYLTLLVAAVGPPPLLPALFHLRPCLARALENRSDEEESVSRYRRSFEKPQVPVRTCTELIFFTSTRSPL